MIRRKSLLISCAVTAGLSGLSASAATVETRSNYMGSTWNGWSNAGNWAGVQSYSAEPGDGGGDINYIKMAHDDTSLYINLNQASGFAYGHGTQNIYFDTNGNPGYESNGTN